MTLPWCVNTLQSYTTQSKPYTLLRLVHKYCYLIYFHLRTDNIENVIGWNMLTKLVSVDQTIHIHNSTTSPHQTHMLYQVPSKSSNEFEMSAIATVVEAIDTLDLQHKTTLSNHFLIWNYRMTDYYLQLQEMEQGNLELSHGSIQFG